jgi:ribonuclease HII
MRLPGVRIPQKGVVDGDSICVSIAAASIVAKVTRDRLMVELDGRYPGYGLAQHKGYGTPEHLEALQKLGPCPIHRKTFQPVRDHLL